jgi:hypothetical protein
MKVNFVGGKLKLKNQKDDTTIMKMKKIISKDIYNKTKSANFISKSEDEYLGELEKNIRDDNQDDQMTAYEKAFYERKMKKLPEKIKNNLILSYKEKSEQFKESLSKLPQHYDIPKVGPG